MAALLKQLSPTRKHEMSLDDAVARTQELSAAAIEGRQFIFEKKALLLQELEDSFCEGNFTTPQPCMPGTRRNVRAQLQSGYLAGIMDELTRIWVPLMECLPVGPIEEGTVAKIAGALKDIVVSLSLALGNFQQSIVDEAVPALAVLVACEDSVYSTLNVYHLMFERRLGYDDRHCVANMELLLKDPVLRLKDDFHRFSGAIECAKHLGEGVSPTEKVYWLRRTAEDIIVMMGGARGADGQMISTTLLLCMSCLVPATDLAPRLPRMLVNARLTRLHSLVKYATAFLQSDSGNFGYWAMQLEMALSIIQEGDRGMLMTPFLELAQQAKEAIQFDIGGHHGLALTAYSKCIETGNKLLRKEGDLSDKEKAALQTQLKNYEERCVTVRELFKAASRWEDPSYAGGYSGLEDQEPPPPYSEASENCEDTLFGENASATLQE